jgi:hypothetical protein
VPAPSLTISSMSVSPGDHMHASPFEVVADSNLWTITIQDVTRNESFTTTLPYASTHATAEWIEATDSSGHVIGTPSAPDSDVGACGWTCGRMTRCTPGAPSSPSSSGLPA